MQHSYQFSSVPWLIGMLGVGGVGGGHEGRFSREPLPACTGGGPCEQFWHGLGCPLFDVVHPASPQPTPASPILQGALKDGFWRGCRGVWHARTMQVSVSWQLPEEVPVDPQGSWSCSAPSRWSCAPSRTCGEVSSCTWFRKPGAPPPFFFSRLSKQRWKWQDTCRPWTCLQSCWCCTARSCLVWPLPPLLRQSWCELLLNRCHPGYFTLVTSSNFWLLIMILLFFLPFFLCWLPFHLPSLCLRMCLWGLRLEVYHCFCP